MKLLIVEDDPNTADFMKQALEEEHYVVRTVGAAREAKLQLLAFEPDLVILDRGLPDQNGLDFCRELRLHPIYSDTRVIFLSAAKEPAEIEEGLKAGGNAYLTKPVKVPELAARIRALLGSEAEKR